MPADPPSHNFWGVNFQPMPQVGPPVTGAWGVGQTILDASYDIYTCIQASDSSQGIPAIWKQQTSGGAGGQNIVTEDLTSQVNGNTNTFTTAQARVLGTLAVFLNGQHLGTPGTLVGGAHVEEVNNTTFKLDVVPDNQQGDPPVTEELHVRYNKP
jgi:hypothetical protein